MNISEPMPQDLVDKLFDKKNNIPEKIGRWIEDAHYNESGELSYGEFLININSIARELFSDRELLSFYGFVEKTSISMHLRIKYARERISVIARELDGWNCPQIFTCKLTHSDGRTGYVGALLRIAGQAGPDFEFRGLYTKKEEFICQLRSEGFLSTKSIDEIKDSLILQLWTNKKILLTREISSMGACFEQHLCLEQIDHGLLRLSTCRYEIIGSVYDLIPEEELYDDNGEINVPSFWEGKEVIGLTDGEYMEINNLVEESSSADFGFHTIELAREFCKSEQWSKLEEFKKAWRMVLKFCNTNEIYQH